MIKCSIIIASFNEALNLERCLNSLRKIAFPKEDHEIIVVDNNSTDNTCEIAEQFSEVVYLKEDKQGASSARNKGIANSQGEILVFLDADAEVEKDWLSNIILPFTDEKTGAVGGAILPFNEKSIISQYLGSSLFMKYPRYGKKRNIKGFPSCNLAIRKDLIIQGFDSENIPYYGEDKDICYQIIAKGYKVLFEPEAIVRHHHPESNIELFTLLRKSSIGRLNMSKKYPFLPDIILLNIHFPILYALLLLSALFAKELTVFLLIALPALLYLLYASIISFIESKNFLLSFFVKPVYDILSVFIIYFSYHYYKLRK